MDQTANYPTKVQQVLRAIERAERPWTNVQVEVRGPDEQHYPEEPRGTMYVITAERPGNVFVAETLQLFVSTTYWPWCNRTTQRGVRGTIHRFGGDRKVRNARELYRVSW